MDEDLKQKLIPSVLAFNVVIIIYQIFFNWQFTTVKFLLGAIIAGAVAGATFAALAFMKK